jgi:hypothetical protein
MLILLVMHYWLETNEQEWKTLFGASMELCLEENTE